MPAKRGINARNTYAIPAAGTSGSRVIWGNFSA